MSRRSITKPEWIANLISLAALASSLYAVHVTRETDKAQEQRALDARAMQYTTALRFDLPYHPRLIRTPSEHIPDHPPYLIVPARVLFTNASTLPQAFNDIMFSFDGMAYYPALTVREPTGAVVTWPTNIQPGTSVALDVELPLPVSEQQAAAIEKRLKLVKTKVTSWPQFEDAVLREIFEGSEPLVFSLSRKTYFWIEVLSPSPGFPRKILFNDWVPPHWVSDH
jgi:hypothetical protein